MRVELRNGEIVDVPDPREKHSAHQAAVEKYGRWVPEYEDGVPVRMRWYAPKGTAEEIARRVSEETP